MEVIRGMIRTPIASSRSGRRSGPGSEVDRSTLENLAKAVDKFLSRLSFGRGAGRGISGELTMTAVFLAALIAFLVVLGILWSRRDFSAADRSARGSLVGRAAGWPIFPKVCGRGAATRGPRPCGGERPATWAGRSSACSRTNYSHWIRWA